MLSYLMYNILLLFGNKRTKSRLDVVRSHSVHVSGVAKLDNLALGAGNHALDDDHAGRLVHGENLLVLESDRVAAHSASHLSAGENSTGISVLTGGSSGSMLQRDTMGRGETVEAVSLHDTGKALALGGGLHVHVLADLEVGCEDLGGHGQQTLLATHSELGDRLLGVDLGRGKLAELRLGHLLSRLVSVTHTDHHSVVAVFSLGFVARHLAQINLQHGGGHVHAVLVPRDHSSLESQGSSSRNQLLSGIGGCGSVVSLGSLLGRDGDVGRHELCHASAEDARGQRKLCHVAKSWKHLVVYRVTSG